MILLDTHALIWLLTEPDSLSVKSKKAIEQDYKKIPIFVSSITIWEICLLAKRGKIDFFKPLERWLTELNQKTAFQFVPIDNTLAYLSQTLPGSFHPDPADSLIVATARHLGATLITKDAKIRKYKHVKTLW